MYASIEKDHLSWTSDGLDNRPFLLKGIAFESTRGRQAQGWIISLRPLDLLNTLST